MASSVAWIRSFTAVPLHALAGVFMGFFLIKSIFENENLKINLFLSLFFPVCLHGLYNFILTSNVISSQLIYVLLLLMFIRSYFVFKNLRQNQEKTGYEDAYQINELITPDILIVLISTLLIVTTASFII